MDFKIIKLLVLDFDGVLTNNKVFIDENGKEAVICDRRDGHGIVVLSKDKFETIVISNEKSSAIKHRCNKLRVDCFQGIDNKLILLREEIKKRNISAKEVCYVGNDENDIDSIMYAGIGVAVNDAFPEVKKEADYITKNNGGDGAVREVIEEIIKSKLKNVVT